MVSQRQWVPQWLICRKAKEGFFSYIRKKRIRHNGQSSFRYGGPQPTEVSGGGGIKSSFPMCPKEEGGSFSSVHSELPCCLSPDWLSMLPDY